MSNKEEKKSILTEVADLKKNIMMMRIKSTSGDNIDLKEYRAKKKEVARLLTKYNDKKAKK